MALPYSNATKTSRRNGKNVDPDQTAPLGEVLSWSILFACACLFRNLGSYGIFQDLNIDYSQRQRNEEGNEGYSLSQLLPQPPSVFSDSSVRNLLLNFYYHVTNNILP